MFDLGFDEHDITDNYEIGWTPASRAYDHGITLQIAEHGDRRLVAVPREDVEAQCGRHASGLYGLRLEPVCPLCQSSGAYTPAPRHPEDDPDAEMCSCGCQLDEEACEYFDVPLRTYCRGWDS
jgi:hypothetical protein